MLEKTENVEALTEDGLVCATELLVERPVSSSKTKRRELNCAARKKTPVLLHKWLSTDP
jgi:hypothetical protein